MSFIGKMVHSPAHMGRIAGVFCYKFAKHRTHSFDVFERCERETGFPHVLVHSPDALASQLGSVEASSWQLHHHSLPGTHLRRNLAFGAEQGGQSRHSQVRHP